MGRKDFWHVKGKLLAITVLCASVAATLWIVRPETGQVPPTETAIVVPAAPSDTLRDIPALTDVPAGSAVPTPKPSVTYPTSVTASSVDTPAQAHLEIPVIQVTETVQETPLPLKENPIPSTVPADKGADIVRKTATTEQETDIRNEKRPVAGISEETRITFPSAFTPNGDGLNDTYRPLISNEVSQYMLSIYNRKNQLVFQTTHPDEAWDGNYCGTPQPHGAYLCLIRYTTDNGDKKSAKGEFLLLRD
jgi:gliding motility-associated-like protein